MRSVIKFFRTLERDRAIESGKLVFGMIGVGTVLGDLAETHVGLIGISACVFFMAWYAIYAMVTHA